VRDRLKTPARWVLRRLGYVVFRDASPDDLANPLPAEVAAQRLMLRAVIESRGVNCVIDVGAHTGGYGSELREAGYRGDIISIEPVAASFEVLNARAARDPRWHARRLALGSADGRARMRVARESNFSSFLRPSRFALDWFGGSVVEREEEVEVRRLDGLFEALVAHVAEPRVMLKTDTQGWDLEVIQGAQGCLGRVAVLQIELSVRAVYEGPVGWLEALATLRELGFRPAQLTAVGRDSELALVELDGLFVRGS
jgi:FkbM family methyltransferase